MTKNEAIQRATRLEREVNECGREIRSLTAQLSTLTAANERMKGALEAIRENEGRLFLASESGRIAREALKEEV